jgi:hypothetical protein
VFVLAIGDIYISGVAIDHIYYDESFGVILFRIVCFCPFFGFRLRPLTVPDQAVVKPDKQHNRQQT